MRTNPCHAALLLVAATSGAAELTLPRTSPKASVSQTVGLTDITVTYSRPGVKGRTIWGDLVPYDKVWRTGANEATVITFSADVTVLGGKLAAGTYSLHTIPTAGEWTVILNRDANLWGSYAYQPEADALRAQVRPRPAAHTEWLTFSFPAVADDRAELVLAWEKLEIPIPIETGTLEQGFAAIDKALAASKSDAWRLPYRAADFAFTHESRLDEAWTWIEQSLAVEQNFFNLGLKARMLAKKGDTAAAVALAEKAIARAKETGSPPDTASLERPLAEWKARTR